MSNTGNEKRTVSSRAKFLRIMPLVAVALIDVLFLAMLDSIFYSEKRELIPESKKVGENMGELLEPIDSILKDIQNFRGTSEQIPSNYFARSKKYLEKNVPEILAQDTIWFRVTLTGENEEAVYDYSIQEKVKLFNDWTNCLFSRSFHAPVGHSKLHLTVYYATPKGWPSIERMVIRYWIYAVLFVTATWAIYGWLLFYVFRPLHRVGRAIEGMTQSENAVLILHPRHAIERAFNRLAKNQREVLFGLEIERIVDELHSQADDSAVVEIFLRNVCGAVQKIYSFERVETYRYYPDGERFEPLSSGASETRNIPFPAIKNDSIEITDSQAVAVVLRMGDETLGGLYCEPGHRFSPGNGELRLMAQEIEKQSKNGLARAFARSRTLTEERNRFGINLATNMGHDLTNIIASGKWDLDTIQRAQQKGIVTLDERKGSFFEDAVNGLKNNLSFLQEMVNIYRSFGYTRRPQYERIRFAVIFRETIDLFRRSSSEGITIELDFDEPAETDAEPRLLRMALFNLLANASQAIRRNTQQEQQGEILVTLRDCEDQTVSLSVSDNGPGIRDVDGNPLNEQEINRIFQSGYSTKDSHSGGGLGLAWVKSIIEDFHGGTIHAENLPERGARIVLRFPKNYVSPIHNV